MEDRQQRCEALTDRHYEWHRDFAKLLTSLSAVALTLLASFLGVSPNNMGMLFPGLSAHLLVIFLGSWLLYQMLKMPIYERTVSMDPSAQNKGAEEKLRSLCLKIHTAQVICFVVAFLSMAFWLLFRE